MKTYRFEIAAYEEIDIDAETKEEAEEKAKEYWVKNSQQCLLVLSLLKRWKNEKTRNHCYFNSKTYCG